MMSRSWSEICADYANIKMWLYFKEVDMIRHECPILAQYGHCGKSEACKECKCSAPTA